MAVKKKPARKKPITKKVTKKKVTKKENKRPSRKIISDCVFKDGATWTVQYGELKRGKGRPMKEQHLFKVAAEKLPYESLSAVKKHLKEHDHTYQGVYVAFDSMGCPRYVGRGNIFSRLEARKKAHPLELQYYSFYVVSKKQHEREVETLLIRAASFLLEFNEKKRRVGLSAGAVNDYEPGMYFYERQRKKGKKTEQFVQAETASRPRRHPVRLGRSGLTQVLGVAQPRRKSRITKPPISTFTAAANSFHAM